MADQKKKAAKESQNWDEGGERFEVGRTTKAPNILKFADRDLEVTDPLKIQPVGADVLTENRIFDNVICLSFGNVVTDGNGTPEVRVSVRIRLPLTTAIELRNRLDELLRVAIPGKEKAN